MNETVFYVEIQVDYDIRKKILDAYPWSIPIVSSTFEVYLDTNDQLLKEPVWHLKYGGFYAILSKSLKWVDILVNGDLVRIGRVVQISKKPIGEYYYKLKRCKELREQIQKLEDEKIIIKQEIKKLIGKQ